MSAPFLRTKCVRGIFRYGFEGLGLKPRPASVSAATVAAMVGALTEDDSIDNYARRKQAFISLISFISTLGVAVGVAALIIAIALMNGLQGELRDRLLGSAAHIFVSHTKGPITNPAEDVALLTEIRDLLRERPA